MKAIVDHRGCVVPGSGNSGNRCISSTCKSNWGGKRIQSKEVKKALWIHDDAVGCTGKLIEEAALKVEKREDKMKIELKKDEMEWKAETKDKKEIKKVKK